MDVHTSVGTEPIILLGTDEQKRRYLPCLAAGQILGAFALTEPEAGSDAASLKTTAVRDGDAYVLNGAKTFITNAGRAGLYTVMAVDRPLAGRERASAPSWSRPGRPASRSARRCTSSACTARRPASYSSTTAVCPASNRLGAEGEGFKVAMLALDSGRIGISAQAIGHRPRGAGRVYRRAHARAAAQCRRARSSRSPTWPPRSRRRAR